MPTVRSAKPDVAAKPPDAATSATKAHGWSEGAPVDRPWPPPYTVERLLVPLDGTFYSERALPYAAALAQRMGAAVTLAHVILPPSAQATHRLLEHAIAGGVDRAMADITPYLKAHRVLEDFRAPAVSVATIGDAAIPHGIARLAAEDKSSLIALSPHARRGLERRVLGSVTDALVEQISVPLLVIPPRVIPPAHAPAFARILVALDGSALAEHALALLVGLLRGTGSIDIRPWEITLLSVVERQGQAAEARRYLEGVRRRLAALAPPPVAQFTAAVEVGSAPGALVAAARWGPRDGGHPIGRFDALLLATHGRGGLGGWLYGSVARYVLPRIAIPVMLAHPARR